MRFLRPSPFLSSLFNINESSCMSLVGFSYLNYTKKNHKFSGLGGAFSFAVYSVCRPSSDVSIQKPPSSTHPYQKSKNSKCSLIYTETDEAPALATFSLLPIISKFAALAGLDVVPSDISLAGRVLAAFPEKLRPSQRVSDNLSHLGELCKMPEVTIIKLPNISASIPQLNECINELRSKGFDIPLYPSEPKNVEEMDVCKRYTAVLGSAVNPILREGNSDRRVEPCVKTYARMNPHKMGIWSKASRTHVSHMEKGDFFESEKSMVNTSPTTVVIEHISTDGTMNVLKESTSLEAGEIIDAATMTKSELCHFFEREIKDAKDTEILLSLHLKATMMKISDPIIFGHCVKSFFKNSFQKHSVVLNNIGANPNNGLGSLYQTLDSKLPPKMAEAIKADFESCYEDNPRVAMVNSEKGITNLHVPSDVIIDASMPVIIRDSGKMWNKDGVLEDTKCLIPDRSYATIYQEMINYVKSKGQFDVTTMGNISNVGLMAKKAQEYGSHDKTFEIKSPGTVVVRDIDSRKVYIEHYVNEGDIWRMCQTKDESIKNWVNLAVSRAKESRTKAIFWLDKQRAHDKVLIEEKVNIYLKEYDLSGLDISIMEPTTAMRVSMERATDGKDTISVTGNVLRDYLTDLFPILELGTSAKMLSIVPLLAGGCLYETGAGGSAPKHVQQFMKEGHLRWDSLGEYLATAVALSTLGEKCNNSTSKMLGDCLNKAVGRILDNRKSPSRRVNEIDNRATNFYIALYWSEYLSKENSIYTPLFNNLSRNRTRIVEEFKQCQGGPVDLGGYYKFDYELANRAMNPSFTFRKILEL